MVQVCVASFISIFYLFIYDFSEADQDEKKDNQMDVDGDVLIDDGIFFFPYYVCVS